MQAHFALQKFLDYSLYVRCLSKHTVKSYENQLNFFLSSQLIEQLSDISENKIRDFLVDGRVTREWKIHTCRSYHKSLSVFIKWCIKTKQLEGENFMLDIEKPRQPKTIPRGLKKEEAQLLLDVTLNLSYSEEFLRRRNHAILATFMFAGLRKKELNGLHMTDVDTENLTIFIRQGKGGKDRIIPMPFTLAHILNDYLVERKKMNKTCPEFFASYTHDMGFTEYGLRHFKKKIQNISGIKFTIHGLRHTFATLMIEGGCDIYSLSKMMGHSDISTTTIYLSASAEHLRGQILKHPLN